MYDFLWFLLPVVALLPVAAVSGWLIGRREISKHKERVSTEEINTGYYEGLNYLLNEQPDKAVEVFVKMLQVDSETVELHLALGNLFRRRGEIDRATMLHQNLIARPTLRIDQRDQALLELGQDYLKAGLLDRAERLFIDLKQSKEYQQRALLFLMEVYQQEKDWEAAITTATEYERASGEKKADIIAHYFCELAEVALRSANPDAAKQFAKKALSVDPRSARASLIQGRIEMKLKDYKAAAQTLMKVEVQNPSFISEIVEPLMQCYEKLENAGKLTTTLNDVFNTHGGISSLLALTNVLVKQESTVHAVRLLEKHLENSPSLKGVKRYLDLVIADTGGQNRQILTNVNNIIAKLVAEGHAYQCNKCGFYSHALYWQCPSCKTWSSIKAAL